MNPKGEKNGFPILYTECVSFYNFVMQEDGIYNRFIKNRQK